MYRVRTCALPPHTERLATETPTGTVVWGDSRQRSDLPTVEAAREVRPHAGGYGTAGTLIVHSPHGAGRHRGVQIVELRPEPGDVLFDLPLEQAASVDHDDLSAPGYESPQAFPQFADSPSPNREIYRVRLGQPARGPGELTRLSWVDHHNWDAAASSPDLRLIPSRGLQHYQRSRLDVYSTLRPPQRRWLPPILAGWPDSDNQVRMTHPHL